VAGWVDVHKLDAGAKTCHLILAAGAK
jgi:hypothetical protein